VSALGDPADSPLTGVSRSARQVLAATLVAALTAWCALFIQPVAAADQASPWSALPGDTIPRFLSTLDATKAEALRRRLRILDDHRLEHPPEGFCAKLLAATRVGTDAEALEPTKEAESLGEMAGALNDIRCSVSQLTEPPIRGAVSQPDRFALYRLDPTVEGAPRYAFLGSRLDFQHRFDPDSPLAPPPTAIGRLSYAKLLTKREERQCRAQQLKQVVVDYAQRGYVEPSALFVVKYQGRFYPSLFFKTLEQPSSRDPFVLTRLIIADVDSSDDTSGCDFSWR
jgi:hypothetical protein